MLISETKGKLRDPLYKVGKEREKKRLSFVKKKKRNNISLSEKMNMQINI